MAKRTADSASISEGYGLGTSPPNKRIAHSGAQLKLPSPLYKASVEELADSGTIRVNSSTADMDTGIMQRIKKCLDRANHPNTPEAEAKAALHLATRLMAQYNVSQAEVLAHEPPSIQRQYAGQSMVSIRRVDGDMSKPVRHQTFIDNLGRAMTIFFDCKYYSSSRLSSLNLTFYGIAENTVAAAMSFEMTYNLICEQARPYRGVGSKNSYCLGASEKLKTMARKEKAAEEKRVTKAEQDEIAHKVRQEEAERQAQLERLTRFTETSNDLSTEDSTIDANCNDGANRHEFISLDGGPFFDMDEAGEGAFDNDISLQTELDDETDENIMDTDFKVEDDLELRINSYEDLAEELHKLIKPEQVSLEPWLGIYSPSPQSPRKAPTPPPKQEPSLASPSLISPELTKTAPLKPEETETVTEAEAEPSWASHMQLISFRATAQKIAEEYLTNRGMKMKKGRARSSVIRDEKAYKKGAKDGEKIDVFRKQIKE